MVAAFLHAGRSTGAKTKEGRIMQKRGSMIHRVTTGKALKCLKEVWNDEEKALYTTIMNYVLSNYEIDELAADQIATAYVQRNCFLIPKMQEGGNVDLNPTSENIRKWLVEYKLTPKSKEKDVTNITNVTFGVLVERLAKKKKEEEIEENGTV